jgi:branched-chain amino acid transport system ATP-binding protein
MRSGDVILETSGLTKEFRGFIAVDGVNLKIRRGTIHALIGPNGAGKTTCFNLLTKFLTPTRGRITYNGSDITAMKPADIARLGLVRSFQISAVFPHLTVLENVRIALQRKRGGSFDFWRSARVLNALDGRALELIEDVGLSAFSSAAAVELPYGRKRALEIATTLALDPEMMLLDEPTSGMTAEDVDRITSLVRNVGAEPDRADGRAQPFRRVPPFAPDHRPCTRTGARGGRLRERLARPPRGRSVYRHRPWLTRSRQAGRPWPRRPHARSSPCAT